MTRCALHDPTGKRRGGSRGFLLADMLMGLAIVSVLTIALAVAASGQGRATHRLAENRRAVRIAERVLDQMQLGRLPESTTVDGGRVTLERVDGGEPIAGGAWVRIIVRVNSHEVALVGVVPGPMAERVR